MKEINIGDNQCGQRLDKFLHKYLREAPGSFIYKMLRKKNIKLNGKRAEGKEKLCTGDVVTLYLSEETLDKFRGESQAIPCTGQNAAALNIVYENKHILLIDKPAGVLSQKAKADDVSMVEYVTGYVGETEPGFSPGICNRLDRNTSGLLIAGKTLAGLQTMSELLRERTIEKYYLAVVLGEMRQGGVVEGWLVKDSKTNRVTISKHAVPGSSQIRTGYEPLGTDGIYTVVKVRLYTGKTHQIRSHLASISHPVAGDVKYGGKTAGIRRQLLHAWELRFPEMEAPLDDLSSRVFRAQIPADFFSSTQICKLVQTVQKQDDGRL